MPIKLTIDPTRRVVISSGSGVVSDGDLMEGRAQLAIDPHFDREFDRIWDLSAATDLCISDEVLQAFAAKSLSRTAVRRAVVCVSPRVAARVLQFVEESRGFVRDVALFPTLVDALNWLATPRAEPDSDSVANAAE